MISIIFLELKSAFDTITWEVLLKKLSELRFPTDIKVDKI